MKPENRRFVDQIRPLLSVTTFVILIIGVGFLSVNFILALISKFS
ncbi:hypothetical protein M595_5905 [Lyngbya aestuarii BL J]|uniref:Uncharacterized protein n=1 Tax=Lyngbya aestuarii BL J TaxID=1348334 RepID=U7Q8J8_9CYAN|nr:hypothetical protein M595_5905 [Lyngbya aestuarii BL J]